MKVPGVSRNGGNAASEIDPYWNDTELYPCIGDLIDDAAAKWGERTAVYMPDGDLTFEGAAQRAREEAGCMLASGVRFGDTVVTMLDNSLDAITLWLGANKLGAIHVPINTAYKGEYLRHHIETSKARIIFCEADLEDRIEAILEDLPAVTTIVVRGGAGLDNDDGIQRLSLENWRQQYASLLPSDAEKPSATDVAALIFTSGTTGPSKAVMISHNYMQHAASAHVTFGRPLAATLYLPFRVFHLAVPSWVVETFMTGAAVAVPKAFSVSGFWPDVNRVHATVAVGIAAMAQLLVNGAETQAERENSTLSEFVVAPCSQDLRAALETRFGASVIANGTYGLTEAVAIVAQSRDPEHPTPPGSSGSANPRYWAVKIFDDYDRELPAGEVGEIVCRPVARSVMMSGYWERPADTLAAFRNMWFHTGDLGRMDVDGNLFFADRKKDYLRYRGENISSLEVEGQFLEHPALLEAAVHAVPSPLGEDDLKVTVVLKDGATLTEEELARWSVERLPYFAVPRYVEFRDELPKNQMGKIQKHELRAGGVTASTWDMSTSEVKVTRR